MPIFKEEFETISPEIWELVNPEYISVEAGKLKITVPQGKEAGLISKSNYPIYGSDFIIELDNPTLPSIGTAYVMVMLSPQRILTPLKIPDAVYLWYHNFGGNIIRCFVNRKELGETEWSSFLCENKFATKLVVRIDDTGITVFEEFRGELRQKHKFEKPPPFSEAYISIYVYHGSTEPSDMTCRIESLTLESRPTASILMWTWLPTVVGLVAVLLFMSLMRAVLPKFKEMR